MNSKRWRNKLQKTLLSLSKQGEIMTKDQITHIAREAGFVGMDGDHGALRRFASLVAQQEREHCAKLCDELDRKSWEETGEPMSGYGEAIRERA